MLMPRSTPSWQIANMEGRKETSTCHPSGSMKLRNLAQSLSVPNLMRMISSRRGRNLIDQGKYAEAEPFFIYSAELNRQLGQRRYLAYTLRRLAQVYAETGRLQAARQAAEEALDLFERLGMPDNGAEVQQVLIDCLSSQHKDGSNPSLIVGLNFTFLIGPVTLCSDNTKASSGPRPRPAPPPGRHLGRRRPLPAWRPGPGARTAWLCA